MNNEHVETKEESDKLTRELLAYLEVSAEPLDLDVSSIESNLIIGTPQDEKPNVFLDLDNTVISAIPLEEIEWTDELKDKMRKFVFYNMDDYYVVFERPHLQEFLDFLFANFNVSIWSAATKDYVLYVVEHIITPSKTLEKEGKDRILDMVFFSYHCDLSKKMKKGIKNLTILADKWNIDKFKPHNTIILDDLDKVKDIQPDNCIMVDAFEFEDEGSENDTYLLKLKEKLENYLATGTIRQ